LLALALSCPRNFVFENASIEDSILLTPRPNIRSDRGSSGEKFGSLPNSSANTSAVENCSAHFQYARDNAQVGESAEVNSMSRLDLH
jgi:hypothetical protein